MNLGGRLKLAREKRDLTQQQLAESSGVPQQNISALENRDSKTSEDLFRLADALGINPRWLQDGEKPSGLEDGDTFLDSFELVRRYNTLNDRHKQTVADMLYNLTGDRVKPTKSRAAR